MTRTHGVFPYRRLPAAAAIAVAWLYSLAHFAASGVRQALGTFTGDFLAPFPSLRVATLVGRPELYTGSLAEQWGGRFGQPPVWYYGPLFHLVSLPLFAFPNLRDAFVVWLFVNYVIVAATLAILIGVIDDWRPRFGTVTIAVVLTLNFGPFLDGLAQRVIELFELLLLVGAFALYRKRSYGMSGVLVGIAAMTKFLPFIYLPYFVVKRNWRALGGALAVIVPVTVITQFVLGWQHSGTMKQLGEGSFYLAAPNQSLSGMIFRVLDWAGASLDSGVMLSRIAILLCLAGVCWLFLRTRECTTAEDLEWAALAAIMILVPPHNQNYYLLFLLFGYIVLFARYRDGTPAAGPLRWFVLVVSFLLTGVVIPMSVLSRIIGVEAFPLYLELGVGFVGAATLIAILVAELLGQCRVARA